MLLRCVQILLATLAELGIADSALSWFTSYLTNRTYQGTWNGAARPTSPRIWPDPATSAGSGPSSRGKQRSSWSKRSSSPASTTATHSWLDSLPPRSNLCSVSRTRQHDSCSTCRSSPMCPLSSTTSTGSLQHLASDSRRWYRPTRLSTEPPRPSSRH